VAGVDTRLRILSGLLRLLLDDFACELSSERVLFLVGRLISRSRAMPRRFPAPVSRPTEFAVRLADQDGFRVAPGHALERLHASSPVPLPPPAAGGSRWRA